MIRKIKSIAINVYATLIFLNKGHSNLYDSCTVVDIVCQWFAAGQWFSPGTPVFSTNKNDHHDITEILLKVALNTINPES